MAKQEAIELLEASLNSALDGDNDTRVDELFDVYMAGNYDSYTLAIAGVTP